MSEKFSKVTDFVVQMPRSVLLALHKAIEDGSAADVVTRALEFGYASIPRPRRSGEHEAEKYYLVEVHRIEGAWPFSNPDPDVQAQAWEACDCPSCNATGSLNGEKCRRCDGLGVLAMATP